MGRSGTELRLRIIRDDREAEEKGEEREKEPIARHALTSRQWEASRAKKSTKDVSRSRPNFNFKAGLPRRKENYATYIYISCAVYYPREEDPRDPRLAHFPRARAT